MNKLSEIWQNRDILFQENIIEYGVCNMAAI